MKSRVNSYDNYNIAMMALQTASQAEAIYCVTAVITHKSKPAPT
jgi:hypothetical protein